MVTKTEEDNVFMFFQWLSAVAPWLESMILLDRIASQRSTGSGNQLVLLCHQQFLLYLVPTNLTHLFKVQTSTYTSMMTLIAVFSLEDFY